MNPRTQYLCLSTLVQKLYLIFLLLFLRIFLLLLSFLLLLLLLLILLLHFLIFILHHSALLSPFLPSHNFPHPSPPLLPPSPSLLALQREVGVIDQVVTFLPNETEKCVTFKIMDDDRSLEEMEQLTFNITILSQVSN